MSASLSVGNVCVASCTDLSFEGKGVCHIDGQVVFVNSMYPGDSGLVRIKYKRAGVLFGEIVKLERLSEDRIAPLCKVPTACGGCVFQAYSYEAEKRAKQDFVQNQLDRNHIYVTAQPTIGMERPYGYRNKVEVPFGLNDKKELAYGFYGERSHRIIERGSCSINDPRIESVLSKLLPLLKSFEIKPYDEKDGSGLIRHALVRSAIANDEMMLVLVMADASALRIPGFIKTLQETLPEITSAYLNVNGARTNVVLGDRFVHLYGDAYLHEALDGLTFSISPGSFFQVNSQMAEILYKTAMYLAGISSSDVVFDAYSGTGAIGLFATRKAKAVRAVEYVESAVKDAVMNAERNGIRNYEAIVGDATEEMIRLAKRHEKIDVLFTDPPRKGCSDKFLESALDLSPKTIVYVSCNPITLCRDLGVLSSKYRIDLVQPIDMFPRTKHVETVVLMSRTKE